MTSDCCVFKFFWRAVDGEHLMRFQSETSVFKFIRDNVDLAFDVALQLGGGEGAAWKWILGDIWSKWK